MENYPQHNVLLVVLLFASILTGGCFPSSEKHGTSTRVWHSEIHPDFFLQNKNPTSDQNSRIVYVSSHTRPLQGGNDNYCGAEATLDVYGFNLEHGQESAAAISILNRGDGQPSSLSAIQFGWEINPGLYNDSHTHFFTSWTSCGPLGKCDNMNCPGFQKTPSSIAPGSVITPLSHVNGKKSYITIRIFKEKSSGDWYVHFGVNGDPKQVGYFPKSLIPGLIDKPIVISFVGYATTYKPLPSPPMGSGYVSTSGNAASFTNLKFIDAEGNDHIVDVDLPSIYDKKGCYSPSNIESAQFFYGGPGCND
uniref:Uncharacterized protein n=1 Tax=Avena sativa TaxID=4498 RepID=A0ACD5ZM69_AVESA